MSRKSRITLALALMSVGIAANLVILIRGEESVGWPLAAVVLLGAASVALVVERRQL